jgi:pimeloyl-ACP methyl ester carboxylesterase
MESRHVAVGSGTCAVRLDGPETRHVVLLLPDAADRAADFDEVCARLHNSGLRTVLVEPRPELDDKAVLEVLSSLQLPMVTLVGRGTGADLAWRLAARDYERFLSVIVVGRGHPAAPDPGGTIHDPDCAPVEVPTTILVGADARERRWADLSGRYVYGDFRVVPVQAADVVGEAARELATEIVLRTSLW